MVSHIKISTAAAIALCTTVVGVLCAILPPLAPDKQVIIAALTGVITTGGLVANAVHALAGTKVPAAKVLVPPTIYSGGTGGKITGTIAPNQTTTVTPIVIAPLPSDADVTEAVVPGEPDSAVPVA